jgi:hypothetical protein
MGSFQGHRGAVEGSDKGLNCIYGMLPVLDWIAPGGLLLVVSHIFAVPILVLRVGLGKKVNNKKLEYEKYFCTIT